MLSSQFAKVSSTYDATDNNSGAMAATTTLLGDSANVGSAVPDKEAIGAVRRTNVGHHQEQSQQKRCCGNLLDRLQCEERFRSVLDTLSGEEFANLEELNSLGAVIDVLDPCSTNGVPMLRIDRSRLRQLGYILLYEGGRLSFIAVRDTFTKSNIVLFEHDYIPIYTLRSYTMLKIQNTFTSIGCSTTQLPQQYST